MEEKSGRTRLMIKNIHRPMALLIMFAAAILLAGLLALVRANPAWAAEPNFELPQHFPVGTSPTTVTNADFNSDGKRDLAAQNFGADDVSVLLGKGDGIFQDKTNFTVGDGPTAVISADLNSDGIADLAVSNQNSNNVSVLLGNGDGTFRGKPDLPAGTSPSSVASADFDGDGDADLAVSNSASNTVSVLLGNGDGTFGAAQPYSVSVGGINPNQIITDDFNGDGDVDLATAHVGHNTEIANFHGGVTVLLGNGDGTFQNASKVARIFLNYSVASADLDADGDKDLVATSYGMTGGCCIFGGVSVALGNGDGTFGASRFIRVGTGHTGPSAVTSADFSRDGRRDLVISNSATDNVSVMQGNGDGTFGAAQNFAAGDLPAFVISPDLNADSFADLAVANQESDNVSVLLNTSAPQTIITSGPFEGQVTKSTSAAFEFSSSEPGSTFQCSLDNPEDSAYSPCTSPKTVPDEGILADGEHIFYVKATGAAGSTDPTPATCRWKVDAAAPAAPVITSPPEGFIVRSIFTVSGTAEAGSTVRLFEGLNSKGTAQANASGQWSMTLAGVSDGSHSYTAKATDAAGNVSGESSPRTVIVDATIPAAPSIVSPAEGSRVRSNFTVSGTAEAGTLVRFLEGTVSKGTAATDSSGNWSINLAGVTEGSHIYKATATDAAGNASVESEPRTVKVDATAPSVPIITSPAEGSMFNVRSFTVSGTAEANSTVELFEGSVSRGTAQANASGQWGINLTNVSDGSHSYKATATDAAGNVSAESNPPRTVIVEATVPTVTGKSPKPNSTGISPTANVIATFSEAMMQNSLNKTTVKLVRVGTTRAVGASLRYPAPNRVVLNPTDSLVQGATYRVTIVGGTNGAKDLAGNALATNVGWSFKIRA
jgi:hypothetical protein